MVARGLLLDCCWTVVGGGWIVVDGGLKPLVSSDVISDLYRDCCLRPVLIKTSHIYSTATDAPLSSQRHRCHICILRLLLTHHYYYSMIVVIIITIVFQLLGVFHPLPLPLLTYPWYSDCRRVVVDLAWSKQQQWIW